MNEQYTYENFVTDGVFTLLDPLFTIIAVFSVLLLIAVHFLAPPVKVIVFVSAFTLILAAQLLIIHGILVDELNLDGSSKATMLFGAATILQLASIALAFIKDKAKK